MHVGQVVSHYRVLQKVGEGGLGEVFLAQDLILNRRVALKVLATKQPDARKQILEEARSAASIDHPHACKIYETGDCEGAPFIVMEFLEGETLSQRLESGPLPLKEAVTIAIEITEALAEAHEKQIIHCDLKPTNIMITLSGHAKLMDFGLARMLKQSPPSGDDSTHQDEVSKPGIAGTPAYMAPEQIRGEKLDARSDIFSLGIVLYEMLAGVHPFRRTTHAATMAAILHEDAVPLNQAAPAIPESLSRVIERSLVKSPAGRYASARDLWAALTGLRSDDAARLQAASPSAAIAILPFSDLSPAHDQEYFCDGLAEELISAIGQSSPIRVASRTASFRYKGATLDLREIGRTLNVTSILEGSVRKAGDRLRIVVKLVDIETGYPIWSERYDRLLNDIFEIQDEIARSIAGKLQGTFAASMTAPAAPTPPRNVRAYESYLKGRYFWNKRTEDDLRRSAEYFESAIAEDANEAVAHAGLADVYVTLSLYGAVRPLDFLPLARNSADRALELKPDLPEALTSRACLRAVFDWDWNSAAREFETAIRLNPNYAQARQWYAMNCLSPLGAFTRAREELKIASETDPVSLAIASSVGVLAFFERDYERAIADFRAVLQMDEAFYLAHYFLGQIYAAQGLYPDALGELERAVAISRGSSESISALGYAQARAGQTDNARRQLQELSQRKTGRYVSPVLVAQVNTGLKEYDDAMTNIEEAFQARSTDLVWLKLRPAFDAVRSNDRVTRLLTSLGLGSSLSSRLV
ncbi:MAG TPA: protein kinase [Terriglobia bacterium]